MTNELGDTVGVDQRLLQTYSNASYSAQRSNLLFLLQWRISDASEVTFIYLHIHRKLERLFLDYIPMMRKVLYPCLILKERVVERAVG